MRRRSASTRRTWIGTRCSRWPREGPDVVLRRRPPRPRGPPPPSSSSSSHTWSSSIAAAPRGHDGPVVDAAEHEADVRPAPAGITGYPSARTLRVAKSLCLRPRSKKREVHRAGTGSARRRSAPQARARWRRSPWKKSSAGSHAGGRGRCAPRGSRGGARGRPAASPPSGPPGPAPPPSVPRLRTWRVADVAHHVLEHRGAARRSPATRARAPRSGRARRPRPRGRARRARPSSSPSRLTSTTADGRMSRMCSIGTRLCPPASTRAMPRCSSSMRTASSTDAGRRYSNGAAFMPAPPRCPGRRASLRGNRPGCPRGSCGRRPRRR